MIEQIGKAVEAALGLHAQPSDLDFTQIALRGIVVFVAALVMVRTGDKRFFAENTAFDVILGLILASTLSRAINGAAPFFETIGAGFVLVWLHRALAFVAFRSHRFGELIKGHSDKVIEDGRVLSEVLRENHVTEKDLIENLRLNGSVDDPAKVEAAWLERSGEISVLKKK
ncbi:MAG: DUF421 domain-containing protein [Verrucomicrobiota bacterium]|nr:DUF421 domain-containing protein [Verrucomicrobiota bacterium]